jgi:hypothetical protein
MGKMKPLKWIEEAEARQVRVIAVSEAVPNPPASALSLMAVLVRLRFWLARSERGRNGRQSSEHVSRLRKIERQT